MSLLVDLATKYRSLLLVGVGLPAGFVFDAVMRARGFAYEKLGAAPERHDEKVRRVQDQVSRWASTPVHGGGSGSASGPSAPTPPADRKPMCTDRKTWMNLSTRFTPKHTWHPIAMGDLRDVLSIDEEKRTVRVEPFVTVGQVTRFLAERGYMLEVTLEIADATIGGLALAAGMTTHSHKVGMLFETVLAYDVVLADGRLVRATADEHQDLFRALPWSHGTLGLLVALELRIMPVKSHIRMRYVPARSQADYCEKMLRFSTADDAPDFVEATVYSKEEAVIMLGDFTDVTTDEDRRKVNPVGRFYKPWFYKHVETFKEHGGEEIIPLEHYLLRHNRSIFWVVADMIPEGNHPLFRALLGWMMPPRIAFLKLSTTPAVRKMTFTMQVFQDIVLPMSAMKRAVDKADELFGMYPILLYPSRVYDRGPGSGQLPAPFASDVVPGKDHAMYFDLGVYGVPTPIKHGERFKTVHAMREMEELTREVRGYPFLYADTFMTREEFEQMFDLTLYREVRKKYGAEGAFPDLYDKIKPEVDVFAVLREEAEWDRDGQRGAAQSPSAEVSPA